MLRATRVLAVGLFLPGYAWASPPDSAADGASTARRFERFVPPPARNGPSPASSGGSAPSSGPSSACDLPNEYQYLALTGIGFYPSSAYLSSSVMAAHMALSGPDVVWSEGGELAVWRANFDDRTVAPLAVRMNEPQEALVAGDRVYWVEDRERMDYRRVVKTATLDGDDLRQIAVLSGMHDLNVAYPRMVADETHLYLVTRIVTGINHSIHRIPLAGGPAVVVNSDFWSVRGLAVDDTHLYWIEESSDEVGNRLKRKPKAGGAGEVLASGLGSFARGLLKVGGDLVFADSGFGATGPNWRLLKVPTAGGTPTILATSPSGPQHAGFPRRIAADEARAYWLDRTSLRSVPLAGGEVAILASDLSEPFDLATDGASVFWTSRSHVEFQGSLFEVPAQGGETTALATGLDGPGTIALAPSSSLVFGEPGRLSAISRAGGERKVLASGVWGDFLPVTADDTHVYVADGPENTTDGRTRLRRVPLGGGPVETVASRRQETFQDLASSEGALFASTLGSGGIVLKVPTGGGATETLFSTIDAGTELPIAAGGSRVAWINRNEKLRSAPFDGGPATTLYDGPDYLDDLVADESAVYFSSYSGEIRSVPFSGGTPQRLAGGASGSWTRLAQNTTDLFWVTQGKVGRVGKDGRYYPDVVSGHFSDAYMPDTVAVNDRDVYFTSVPTGRIVRAASRPPVLGRVLFERSGQRVNENAQSAQVRIRRLGNLSRAASVRYAASNGSAEAGADYVGVTGFATFRPGSAVTTVSVPILDDHRAEGDETLLLRLSDTTGCYELSEADVASLTIVDNDRAGTVQFSSATFSVAEPGPSVMVAVTRLHGSASDVTVQYQTLDGSAVEGVNYLPVSGSLTFARGVVRQTFAVPILDDGSADGPKTVRLILSSPGGGASLGTPREAFLTIQEDNPVLQFSAASFSVGERSSRAVIEVRRFGPAGEEASVAFRTSDGSALAGHDYLPASGTLLFPVGATVRSFSVPILDDTAAKGPRTVLLALDQPSAGAAIGQLGASVLTIGDDDRAGRVAFGATIHRTAAAEASARVLVRRVGGSASGVSVDYATTDGTAQQGVHYEHAQGTLSFGAGETQKFISVAVLGLESPSKDLSLGLSLTNPGGGAVLGAPPETTLVLESADPKLAFSAPVYGVNEAGPKATVTVRRHGPKGASTTVDFASADGTATAGQDYQAVSGTLEFRPNMTSRTFSVPVAPNGAVESDETVSLSLDGPTGGAALGEPSAAVLNIRTDDPSVGFRLSAYAVAESAPQAWISVRRGASAVGTVTVDYRTSDGSAIAGLDYLPVAGTLTFPPGVTLQKFAVPLLNDTRQQGSHTVELSLSSPRGALLSSLHQAVLTIGDDDLAGRVRFSATDYAVGEAAGTAFVTIERSGGVASGASVNYSTADGSAEAGAHYVPVSGTVLFEAGETARTLAIEILPDGVSFGNRWLRVVVESPTGGLSLSAPTTATLWIVDADSPD